MRKERIPVLHGRGEGRCLLEAALHKVGVMRGNLLQLHGNV